VTTSPGSPVVVLLAHGALAQSLIDTAIMIVGDCDGVFALGLAEGEAPAALHDRLQHLLADHVAGGRGALLLVDLLGGSPSNIATQALVTHGASIEVVTGVNLAMLIETLTSREGKDVHSMAELAAQSGEAGIVNARVRLQEQGVLP
jgi:mannose/fructose/sorbose-specific phosphotransferase system IIA component